MSGVRASVAPERDQSVLAAEDGACEMSVQELEEITDDDSAMPMLAAESALTREWLTPEEDEAWAHL